jgi:Flp pilus assembly protein TadD
MATQMLGTQPLPPSRAAFQRGLAAQQAGQVEQAVAEYRRAIRREPGLAAAHFNLGQLLRQLGDCNGAAVAFEGAARLRPNASDAWLNLGAMFEHLGRFDDAVRAYDRAIGVSPSEAIGYYNRGNAYYALGRYDAATASYREAVGVDASHTGAQWNLASALLAQGELIEGWTQYEWRWRHEERDPSRGWPWPLWQGESVGGKRILVWREQGLGDEILFTTCVRDLVAAGGEVTLIASPRLVPLLQRSLPGVEVIPDATHGGAADHRDPGDFEYHIPLGSLPRFLRQYRDAFPIDGKYLVPESASYTRWADRLDTMDGIKIGICWRSGLRTAARERQYTSLEEWGPLFQLRGVHWINLQYDDCAAEIEAAEARFGIKIHRWPEENLKDDLDGVTGLLNTLDAVITAPTAVSSLAGAVGVPTWELDAGGDWTAFGEERSPWFPSIRMVRRAAEAADWREVMFRVASDLTERWPSARGAR